MHRLRKFDRKYWQQQRNLCEELVALIKNKLELLPVWPSETPLTPHLLTYQHDERLAEACTKARLETGDHYPNVHPGKEDVEHLSLPFHCSEVIDRLKEVL
jgi:hypothetical protein